MARFTKRDLKIEILNPNTDAVVFVASGSGDLSIDGFMTGNVQKEAIYERGEHVGMVPGDDGEQSVSWSFNYPREAITSPTVYKFQDLVDGTGAFAALPTADPGGLLQSYKVKVTLDPATTNTGWILNNVDLSASVTEDTALKLAASGTNRNGYTTF